MSSLQEQVQVLLDELVASGQETGVQAAVYRRGELVADTAAGVADPETGTPVGPDTLFYAASTVKGVTATVVHVLADRGLIDYDMRVTALWPEYGAHGKDRTTIRHVLTHSAGVPAIPMDTTLDRLSDWAGMCEAIAALEPWWTPGERSGYHPVTFGFILGEVVRRVTGKRISEVLAVEIGDPLGVAKELYFGVPERERGRVAKFEDDLALPCSHPSRPASRCSDPDRASCSPPPTWRTGPTSSPPTSRPGASSQRGQSPGCTPPSWTRSMEFDSSARIASAKSPAWPPPARTR